MILRNCKRQKKGRKRAKEQTSKRANEQTNKPKGNKRKQNEKGGNEQRGQHPEQGPPTIWGTGKGRANRQGKGLPQDRDQKPPHTIHGPRQFLLRRSEGTKTTTMRDHKTLPAQPSEALHSTPRIKIQLCKTLLVKAS